MAQPRYTLVLNDVRKKLNINILEYSVADTINKLSNNVRFEWCLMSRGEMAEMFGVSDRWIKEIIKRLEKRGLIERNEAHRLRSTALWIDTVEYLFDGVNIVHPKGEVSSPSINDKHTDNYNNIYIPILEHWNSKKIIVHRDAIPSTKSAIGTRTKEGYTVDEIKEVIDNYAKIIESPKHYFKHKWTLADFLRRGFDKFKDFEIANANYMSDKFKNKQFKKSNTDKYADY